VVERTSPQATIRNNIKGYPARILLKNVDPRIRPGMTANVKIPVASADNVTAVPLAAVFTEKNPETMQVERFVYVQQGDSFEKHLVKVGVSDYFYAEIQEGLTSGEVVSLEMPKDEWEKRTHQLASQHPLGSPAGKGGGVPGVNRTNNVAPAVAPASAESPRKMNPTAGPAEVRSVTAGKS